MAWQGILGQDEIALRFANAVSRNRLGGSFLFVGPSGIGKRSFAFVLAQTLLCRNLSIPDVADSDANRSAILLNSFVACGECESCRRFSQAERSSDSPASSPKANVSKSKNSSRARSDSVAKSPLIQSEKQKIPVHPDFFYVDKPADKSLLPLELLIGDKENRSRSGLCYNLSKTSYYGGRKIAIIDDGDFLNLEGANALLKTIEEPPSDSIVILIGTNSAKQLPTIRSRCQIVRFRSLGDRDLATILLEKKYVETFEQGLRLAQEAGGSLTRAIEFRDETLESFRTEFYQALGKLPNDAVDFSLRLNEFVEAAGKEAILRRNRLRLLLTTGLEFYQTLLYCRAEGSSNRIAAVFQPFFQNVLAKNPDDSRLLIALDLTLQALEQIDRNVNVPYIVDSWTLGLARLR